MSDIQKKFTQFLAEAAGDQGQAHGRAMVGAPPGVVSADDVTFNASRIEDPEIVQRLNAYLASASATPVMNPYFLLMRIQDKLGQIGLHFEIPTFVGNSGSVEKPLKQFGGRYGYAPTSPKDDGSVGYPEIKSDDGISQRHPGGLNIKFTWTCFKGLYTIDAQLLPGSFAPTAIKENELTEDVEDD
jgi:hypothetical protein